MSNVKRPCSSAFVIRASKRLRRSMTPTERLFWSPVRHGRYAGLRFRRQQTIGSFVVDFYCSPYRLAVEIDGRSRDQLRDRALASLGVRVLRFSNDEVETAFARVMERVFHARRGEPIDGQEQGRSPLHRPSASEGGRRGGGGAVASSGDREAWRGCEI